MESQSVSKTKGGTRWKEVLRGLVLRTCLCPHAVVVSVWVKILVSALSSD